MELIDFFTENEFSSCEHIYIRPHIPTKRISNALVAYDVRIDPKTVVVLIDDTAFGSGKNGILICENRLIIREIFSSPRVYEYDAVESITCEGRRLFINQLEACKLNMPGKDELAVLFELLNEWITLREKSIDSQESSSTSPTNRKATLSISDTLYNEGLKVISDKVYVRPHIPAKKLKAAINAYGNGEASENVIILVDDTTFGGAKDGILLTGNSIYIKVFTESKRAYDWSSVSSIYISKKTIYINEVAAGEFLQASEKDLGLLLDKINDAIKHEKYTNEKQPILVDSKHETEGKAGSRPSPDSILTRGSELSERAVKPQDNLGDSDGVNDQQITQDEATVIAKILEVETGTNPAMETLSNTDSTTLSIEEKESSAKEKLLTYISATIEQNKHTIAPMIKEKTAEASLVALSNDANIENLARFIYALLPGIVRLALKEQVFIQFMLDNRNKILSGLLPTSDEVDIGSANTSSVVDHISYSGENISKVEFRRLSDLSIVEQSPKIVKQSYYARILSECESVITGSNKDTKNSRRPVQNSSYFQDHKKNIHTARFCAATLSVSIEALMKTRDRLNLVDPSERYVFELDSATYLMLTYATTSMGFLLRYEAGYNEEQANNFLIPLHLSLIFGYANDLLGEPAVKKLRDTVTPHNRLMESETLKDYKQLSNLFAKNLERQDRESPPGHLTHLIIRASIEAFDNPDDRFKLSSKMEKGRDTISTVLSELDDQLESILVKHLENGSRI